MKKRKPGDNLWERRLLPEGTAAQRPGAGRCFSQFEEKEDWVVGVR